MAVVRVEKTKDFTVMSNHHFREKGMSLRAKGLLSFMLSLPNDWDYSIEGLVPLNKDNETSVRKALQELENFGYLERERVRDDKGIFVDMVYHIYENPRVVNPRVETPQVETPRVVNQGQLNTNNNQILNKSNTKEIKDIVEYLNLKTGSNYRPANKDTQKHINARLKEGYTVDDFKKVIDKKVTDWGSDKQMSQYLRPSTLFGTKFEGYLNQSGTIKTDTPINNAYKTKSAEEYEAGVTNW